MNRDKLSAGIVIAVTILHHVALVYHASFAITAAYGGLFLLALILKIKPAFHLALFMILWRTLHLVIPFAALNISAIYLALVFLVTVPFARMMDLTSLSWFTKGDLGGPLRLWSMIVSVGSAVALLAWAYWSDNMGIGEEIVRSVSDVPRPIVLLFGVPAFACLNAFSEEIFYRGIFQEAALRSKLSPRLAIILQASGFAALHFLAGFPNGVAGYLMTFVYGVALGILRQSSRGILLPILTHVTADLAIIFYLCFRFL